MTAFECFAKRGPGFFLQYIMDRLIQSVVKCISVDNIQFKYIVIGPRVMHKVPETYFFFFNVQIL